MVAIVNKNKSLVLSVLGLALLFMVVATPESAMAGQTVMPWDGPMEKIKDSITGPWAAAISLIGVVIAGAMLIFGGELGEFARRIIMLVLVLSLIVAASSIISTLYGGGGALVAGLAVLGGVA